MRLTSFLLLLLFCYTQVSSDVNSEKEENEELGFPDDPVCFIFLTKYQSKCFFFPFLLDVTIYL